MALFGSGCVLATAADIDAAFLAALDRQGAVNEAARLVARTFALGDAGKQGDAMVLTLARALLREDAGFHSFQVLEAGARQWHEWRNADQPGDAPQGQHVLIAVARWLAAHSPTPRAQLQTFDVARRLARGQNLYQGEGQSV